jgi:pilus assembly protein CpaF
LFAYTYQGENPDGSLRGTFVSSNLRPRFLPRLEYFGLADAFLAALAPQVAQAK